MDYRAGELDWTRLLPWCQTDGRVLRPSGDCQGTGRWSEAIWRRLWCRDKDLASDWRVHDALFPEKTDAFALQSSWPGDRITAGRSAVCHQRFLQERVVQDRQPGRHFPGASRVHGGLQPSSAPELLRWRERGRQAQGIAQPWRDDANGNRCSPFRPQSAEWNSISWG